MEDHTFTIDITSKRREIYKNIVVYKNPFKNINETMRIVKRSEIQEEDLLISKWKNWGIFGIMAKAIMPTRSEKFHTIQDSDKVIEQKKFLVEVENVFDSVSKDYMDNFGENVDWLPFITTIDLSNIKWQKGPVDILKHIEDPSRELAMHYHTDQNNYDLESRGRKFGLTVTIYLNDNYEGGEISFAHRNGSEILVTTLKPQAGDVVVFPSFIPYFHGVLPITKGNKYLIRTFHVWEYDGSQEWLNNENKYGKDVWAEMEKNRMHEIYERNTKSTYYNSNMQGENIDPNVIHIPSDLPEKNKRYIDCRFL